MGDLLAEIRFIKDSLPRAERNVAKAVLNNPEQVCEMSLQKFGRTIDSNDGAIVRFCKRMGYDKYLTFKEALKSALENSEIAPIEDIVPGDSVYDILKKVCASNVQVLTDTVNLATPNMEKALEAIKNAKSIHFFGAGDAASVGLISFFKFSKLGIPCSCPVDPVVQLLEAGNMRQGDVAIAISYEGESFNVNNAIRTAKENGATTICITRFEKSSLIQYIDIDLYVATFDFSIGRDIAGRRAAEQLIMDTLYLTLVAQSGGKYDKSIKNMRKIVDRNKKNGV